MEMQKYVTLNNGLRMPLFGFGTFQVPQGKVCEESVMTALKYGYRMIDTAAMYGNESSVGKALNDFLGETGTERKDIFLTTKVWLTDYEDGKTRESFEKSAERLGTDYIDLLLLHQPIGNWKEGYRALESLYREGKVKAIGVCNFIPERLNELMEFAEIPPMVNQIELHPYFSQSAYCSEMKKMHIHPEAWGPLAEGLEGMLTDPALRMIAGTHGKTTAQVILRFNVQRGVSVIPRSIMKNHIKENIEIWDFELSPAEMSDIEKLTMGRSNIVDFYDPKIEKLFLRLSSKLV